MRAAVYYNNHDVRLEERPRPVIGPGEILMRIEASGICGSDVAEWYRLPKAPIVLGHEVAGVVEEVGRGVTGFVPGDRIVTTHHVPCDACRYCRAGNQPYCDTLRTTHFDPGGFCDFVRLPAPNVERGTFKLPAGVAYEEATFVEPLACCVRAFRVARFVAGMNVVVLGSGISGALHILLAKALGAGKVLATDLHPWRIAKARELGADAACDARDDVPARVRETLGGTLADVVIVTAASMAAVAQSLKCVDRGGTILYFALPTPGETFPMPMWDVWRDGITIVHSYAGPPADMAAALELIAARRVDVAATITHRLGLEETALGFGMVLEGAESLKVVVRP
jgi:L-iditol 2-dehydrogenase